MKKIYLFLLAISFAVTGVQANSPKLTPKQINDLHAIFKNAIASAKNKSVLHNTAAMRTSGSVATVPDSLYEWGWSTDTYSWGDSAYLISRLWSHANGTLVDSGIAAFLFEGTYVPTYKEVVTYDSHGNIITDAELESDGFTFQPYELKSYTYDSNNNQLTFTEQFWNDTVYATNSYESRSYDIHNNVLTDSALSWDGSAYSNGSINLYTYDGNNNMLTDTGKNLNSSVYSYNYIDIYNYDSHNDQISINTQVWGGSAFQNYYFITNTYDSNNNEVETVAMQWVVSVYDTTGRDTLTYDGNHNQLSDIYQSWNGSDYLNNQEFLMSYDANNNTTDRQIIRWDGASWSENVSDDKYLFDSHNRQLMHVSEGFNSAGDSISGGDSTYFYFNNLPTAVHQYTAPVIQLYPNPASDHLIIDASKISSDATLQIFDDAGRLVYQQFVAAPAHLINLNTAILHSGVYQLKLQSQEGTTVQQFVKANE